MDVPINYEFFTEDQMTKRLFQSLAATDAVVAQSWRGYGTRLHKYKVEPLYFNREFDIASFMRQTTQPVIGGPFHQLWLYGYEVKGYTKDRKGKWLPPTYASGIDQALVLLQQGADFTNLVLPIPMRNADTEKLNQLFSLCETWCPLVGIMLDRKDGGFYQFRAPQQNPYTTPDKKKMLLLRLISDGYVKDISTVDWAKKHEF